MKDYVLRSTVKVNGWNAVRIVVEDGSKELLQVLEVHVALINHYVIQVMIFVHQNATVSGMSVMLLVKGGGIVILKMMILPVGRWVVLLINTHKSAFQVKGDAL